MSNMNTQVKIILLSASGISGTSLPDFFTSEQFTTTFDLLLKAIIAGFTVWGIRRNAKKKRVE